MLRIRYNSSPISWVIALLILLLWVQHGISMTKKTAAEHYREGLRLFEQGCYPDPGIEREICNKAIEELEKTIELDPKLTDAYLTLGQAYWNKSIFVEHENEQTLLLQQKATTLYRKVINIDPNNAQAHYELSFRTEDIREKTSLLKKTIELNPKHTEARGDLARILVSQGKFDEAFKEYKIHLEVRGSYRITEDGSGHMGFALSLAQTGRLKEAVEVYEKILVVAHEESRFERCHLFHFLDLEPYAAFKEFTDKIEKLRPYCGKTEHRDRAVLLEQQGKLDEAIEELHLQLKENPYYEETYILLENIHKRLGQTEKALEVVRRYFAVDVDPSERCKKYRSLDVYDYERLDKTFIAQLKQECEERRR